LNGLSVEVWCESELKGSTTPRPQPAPRSHFKKSGNLLRVTLRPENRLNLTPTALDLWGRTQVFALPRVAVETAGGGKLSDWD
jgi:hypothetical protein